MNHASAAVRLPEEKFVRDVHREKPFQARCKRALDIVGASLILIAISPLLLVIAVLVKLTSRGPLLYRQQRIMRGGVSFTFFKFRTMVVNADKMRDNLLHLNRANGPLFKIKNDPRVTPVGRVLRACFLDELPQLFNVLRGEMSLVGPRPLLPSEVDGIYDQIDFRFGVPQGITGPWQVNGYHDLTFEEQIEVERTYVETWSLKQDLSILLRTIPLVLKRSGL